MLLMAIFALAIYAEEQDTLDKAKFQAAVPYNQAVEIHFGEKTKMPTEYTQDKGDVSVAQNGKIHAYAADDGKYYIAHEEDGTIYFPEDSEYLFSNLDPEERYTELTIVQFDSIDTSKVTNMSAMFYNCSGLTKLDLSKFDTSNVTNMDAMFVDCHALTKLNVSSFDTSNVTNMNSMFWECEVLEELNISSFDTGNVTNMHGMFHACSGLKELNLSSFDTSKVTDMSWMFWECEVLEELNISSFDTGNVTNMHGMFHACSGLKELNLSSFDTSKVTDMSWMFWECEVLEELNISSFDTGNVTTMLHMFNGCKALTTLDVSNFNTSAVTDMGVMFAGCEALTTLDVSSFDTSKVADMRSMFERCKALTTLDVSSFDTSNVTDMQRMFEECPKLKTIYASKNFNTDNITMIEAGKDVFKHCIQLEGGKGTKYNASHTGKEYARIDGGTSAPGYFTKKGSTPPSVVTDTLDKEKFQAAVPGAKAVEIHFGAKKDKPADYTTPKGDVSVAQNGRIRAYANDKGTKYYIAHEGDGTICFPEISNDLFSDMAYSGWYTKLTSITFNHIDTSNVTSMDGMFEGCQALRKLDLSSFDTSKVIEMHYMFSGCQALETLDLSSFDTSNVTSMEWMFNECQALRKLDLSSFNTSKVIEMHYMFSRCQALKELDVSKFDTSKVIDMEYMFSRCEALTKLDVSNFNTSEVANMGHMFEECTKLKTIYASKNFNTDNITMIEAGKDVFKHCIQLEGGKGTKYDASHIGKEYARIDGVESKPGYFTQKGSTPPSTYHSVTVNVNVDENGTATATPNSAVQGTKITIEAIAKPNYKFVKWEGINGLELTYGNINTAIVKFTMPDKDVTVKAIFEPIPSTTHTIRFESNGGSGSMEAVTVGHGKNYTLPKCEFKAPEGKEFDHWEVKGTAYNAGGQITDIKSDLTIKAVWKKKSSGGSSGGGSSSGSSKKTDNTVKQEQPSSQTPQPSSDSNLAENPAENNIIKKQQTTVFTIGSNIMTVMEDGKSKQTTIDAKSFISQGRTMIPVRYVAESMGMKVEWDKKTMTVILKNKEMTVKIPVKTDKIIVIKADGTKQEYTSDIKPIVKNGRTYLPISNIAKVLDLKPGEGIKWDNNTKQVTIVKQIDIH